MIIDMRHLRTGFPFRTKFGNHVLAGCYSSSRQPVCLIYGVIPSGVDIVVDPELYAVESIIAIRSVVPCNEIRKANGVVTAEGRQVRIDPWPYKEEASWTFMDTLAFSDRIVDSSLAIAEMVSLISFLDSFEIIKPESKIQNDVLIRLRGLLCEYKSKSPASLQTWLQSISTRPKSYVTEMWREMD